MSQEELLGKLEAALGYVFQKREFLKEALLHPSYGYEMRQRMADNQRLEFLGDAVLQLSMTQALYEAFPAAREGELTAMRARLVNRTQMQVLAEKLQLGEMLVLGKGEENNGGRTRGSNLADAMEAVLGAVFIDGGWEKGRAVVERLLKDDLHTLSNRPEGANPKGELQELLQAEGGDAPLYTCLSEEGPAHARRFEVKVEWRGKELGRGQGTSKKEAEIAAALVALEKMKKS